MKSKSSLNQISMALSETFNNADILVEPIGNSEFRHFLSVQDTDGMKRPIGFTYTAMCDAGVEPGLYITTLKGDLTLVAYFDGYLTLMYPLTSGTDNWVERYTDINCVKEAKIIFSVCND